MEKHKIKKMSKWWWDVEVVGDGKSKETGDGEAKHETGLLAQVAILVPSIVFHVFGITENIVRRRVNGEWGEGKWQKPFNFHKKRHFD